MILIETESLSQEQYSDDRLREMLTKHRKGECSCGNHRRSKHAKRAQRAAGLQLHEGFRCLRHIRYGCFFEQYHQCCANSYPDAQLPYSVTHLASRHHERITNKRPALSHRGALTDPRCDLFVGNLLFGVVGHLARDQVDEVELLEEFVCLSALEVEVPLDFIHCK